MLTRLFFAFFDICVALTATIWRLFFPKKTRQIFLNKGELEISRMLARALNARSEVVLFDKARVDILTDAEAIEVDWAHKWAEGIGQALYYGAVTKKTPVVLLLMNTTDEEKYLARVRQVISTYSNTKLKLWLFYLHTGDLDMGKKGVYQIS